MVPSTLVEDVIDAARRVDFDSPLTVVSSVIEVAFVFVTITSAQVSSEIDGTGSFSEPV
jgi:hypothetical protein